MHAHLHIHTLTRAHTHTYTHTHTYAHTHENAHTRTEITLTILNTRIHPHHTQTLYCLTWHTCPQIRYLSTRLSHPNTRILFLSFKFSPFLSLSLTNEPIIRLQKRLLRRTGKYFWEDSLEEVIIPFTQKVTWRNSLTDLWSHLLWIYLSATWFVTSLF